MSFGVSFYSFVVGSVTSIIAQAAQDTETLKNKLKGLDLFQLKTGLPDKLYYNI
jgi:hypothetical protein